MIDLKQVQKEIEASHLFQNWKKEQQGYLVHFFCMNEKEVQVGYYDEKKDVIATFVKAEEITKTEDKEIFRQEKKIAPLDMHNVKISMKDAEQKAEALQKQKYPGDLVSKKIIVLQTINNIPTYNMTLITMTFKMINIRVDAATGNVLEEKMQPIMDFVQTIEKGNKEGKGE
ncbi:hypothetical protein HZC31_03290 [Candidatus Woesearchaeota archaeon]|nr:hypothetical protein [Candidatus Woesearchaeota archaeon]